MCVDVCVCASMCVCVHNVFCKLLMDGRGKCVRACVCMCVCVCVSEPLQISLIDFKYKMSECGGGWAGGVGGRRAVSGTVLIGALRCREQGARHL